MDLESGSSPARSNESRSKLYKTTLCLAYQSFGVVYGDLSTSPIYVYKSTFSGRLRLHEEEAEIFGVLSLVFWTLTLIPLCKYIIFVLGADDNGEGGTFALYSLLCRNSKMGLLSTSHAAPNYRLDDSGAPSKETKSSSCVKLFFEKYRSSRVILLLLVLLGVSMVIGDGILTPTMSVLSAVYGIKVKAPDLHENYTIFVACMILVVLFALQHFGTHRVGFLFAPILIAWLLCISGVGVYNIIHWNPHVVTALSPYYVYNFFRKAGKDGWISLGGIVLCITGAEAMFADLGHFSKNSIRIAFTGFVYPCLLLAYMGEAAYLSQHIEDLQSSFYKSIPETIFWPVFVIATLATIVGSQAIISATFSIISQCRALRCFPRVKIKHTSSHIHGQIYIPEVNWILMVLCLAVVVGFRDTDMIGNAYGLAVITGMFITTILMFLVIVTVWKRNVVVAALFVVIFGSLEMLYLSSCLAKIHSGGWLPILFSLITMIVFAVWHYGTAKKQAFEMQNKVGLERLLSLGPNLGIVRVPGIAFIYSNTSYGVPPMFAHFVTNFPAFHRILIFVSLQSFTVPKVPESERFLVSRIGPPEFRLFRCAVRYGYKDERMDSHNFENLLISKVVEFLRCEVDEAGEHATNQIQIHGSRGAEEVAELAEAKEAGLAYMMGHTCVLASDSSSILKKFVIDILYGFLRQNCRRPAVALGVPHTSLIEVGMVYRV